MIRETSNPSLPPSIPPVPLFASIFLNLRIGNSSVIHRSCPAQSYFLILIYIVVTEKYIASLNDFLLEAQYITSYLLSHPSHHFCLLWLLFICIFYCAIVVDWWHISQYHSRQSVSPLVPDIWCPHEGIESVIPIGRETDSFFKASLF